MDRNWNERFWRGVRTHVNWRIEHYKGKIRYEMTHVFAGTMPVGLSLKSFCNLQWGVPWDSHELFPFSSIVTYLTPSTPSTPSTHLTPSTPSTPSNSHTTIDNGRHFRLCMSNSKTLFHNNMQDELFLMCRSAGIPTIKEPLYLLPDEPLQRPGDIYFPCWSTNSSTLTKRAIDFTAPSIDCVSEDRSGE